MHIFIDESGPFSGFQKQSIAAVGALAVPDAFLQRLEAKYAKIRRQLPSCRGEIKGRTLNEQQVANIVQLLWRHQAVFELSIIDIGAHSEAGVLAYRDRLADYLEGRLLKFNPQAQIEVLRAAAQLRKTSAPLFLQAIATFDVLEHVINHVPLYFAQRYPKELGSFAWVVDGKDPQRVTDWESWWSWYALGALATKSRKRPRPELEGADYTYFARFDGADADGNVVGTDLKLLLEDLRFSSRSEFGLELVDIVTNAVRRAMVENLTREGWSRIPSLMIHRREHYISLLLLDGAARAPERPSYEKVVRHFSSGGRSMLSPRFLKIANDERMA